MWGVAARWRAATTTSKFSLSLLRSYGGCISIRPTCHLITRRALRCKVSGDGSFGEKCNKQNKMLHFILSLQPRT